MKKLNLKKKVISVLTDQEKKSINGGDTTSYSGCSGFLCCNYQGCGPASTVTKCTTTNCPEPSGRICQPPK
jgi:hypothetical protein